jgi:hypothetical protein
LDKPDQELAPPATPPAAQAEDDIIARARLNGLNIDPSALQGEDPFARRATLRSTLLASGRGWVAAAIAVGVLLLGWQFRKPLSEEITRAPTGGVTRLIASDPPSLKQQIVEDLRVAGVQAIGYDRLGLSGVDAQLSPSPSPTVLETLKKHGIAAPGDGVMRVEIVAPERK